MNRIDQLFAGKKKNILSVFYTAGYPHLANTISIANHLQDAGVDLIEIGIPFSDPVADGPVIQESNKASLGQGMSIRKLLEQLKELRPKVGIPVLLMGYLNPILQYGFEKFCEEAGAAGIDGLIIPDLPMREFQNDYKPILEKCHLFNIFMISPSTAEERIRQIDKASQGFIYAVSASSTTGAKTEFSPDQLKYFERLRSLKSKHPFLIGFGISDAATFSSACEYASGAVIGSAFLELLKSSSDLPKDIKKFAEDIRT